MGMVFTLTEKWAGEVRGWEFGVNGMLARELAIVPASLPTRVLVRERDAEGCCYDASNEPRHKQAMYSGLPH